VEVAVEIAAGITAEVFVEAAAEVFAAKVLAVEVFGRLGYRLQIWLVVPVIQAQ
jgi:hypothetical protein